MHDELRQKILANLEREYAFKRKGETYLREGKCPYCGRHEMYTSDEHPWVLRCGRQAKCGAEFHVKDLYTDLFDNWSERYKQTPANPTASADAYLQYARGFDLRHVQGLYTQENFFSPQLGYGSATVRFSLDGGWWERLIDRPQHFGKMKARFAPGMRLSGRWWASPKTQKKLQSVDHLWLVEGIFDALALEHHGITAVATLSSNQFPEHSLEELCQSQSRRPTLIWALDNEPGARAYTQQFVKRANALGFKCHAALIPQPPGRKVDWNDLHLRVMACQNTQERTLQWKQFITEARYQGDLLLARDAAEKGVLISLHTHKKAFPFEFQNQWYWFELDAKPVGDSEKENEENQKSKKDRMLKASQCKRIANCNPQALYFQRNTVTDDSRYVFRINFPHDAPSVKGTFTGAQVSSVSGFKKRLISLAQGAVFTGTSRHLDQLIEEKLYNIQTVETIDFIGYAREHACWILGDLAVRKGRRYTVNEEDFFEFGKLRLKTRITSIRLDIQPDSHGYRTEWLNWIWTCFGSSGLIALAFWTGSLYAEHIRATDKSFPFLEVTGEARSGKTTLLTFLWKLFGRSDYEGFEPPKSSLAGCSQAMSQVSAMPVVMLEADRKAPNKAYAKSFDWDEFKDYFSGGNLRTGSVKNSGNDTCDQPFRGTIVISQNAAVNASEAILTRIVKLHFKRPTVTTDSRIAADNLNALPVEAVSHFIIKACMVETRFLETFKKSFTTYESVLRQRKDLWLERVIKNHAQIMALIDCLALVIPLDRAYVNQAQSSIIAMAIERQDAISADHPLVNEFWKIYDYLENLYENSIVNHSRSPNKIAINLNHFYAQSLQYGQKAIDLNLLRKLLPDSRRHKFVRKNAAICSAIRSGHSNKPLTVKCWIFNS